MALHSLQRISIGVPDVAATTPFYEAFGLAHTAPASFATTDGGEQLRLVDAPWRRIEQIVVAVDDADDLGRIRTALEHGGHQPVVTDTSLQVREPHVGADVVVEIGDRQLATTSLPTPVNRPGAPARVNRPAEVVLRTDAVRPRRLSHIVLGTPNYEASLHFFTELLGFQISDQIPGIMAFTRCSDSHHNLALQAMPGTFFHHVAFEVDSADEVLRGGSNMVEADADRHMWGLGRHAIGSNWFWYLRDPAGNYVEYTADIDQITSNELYTPKDWAGKEFLYAYGPPIPPAFLEPADAARIFAEQSAH